MSCFSLSSQQAYHVPSKSKLPNHLWRESLCAMVSKVLVGPFLISSRDSTLSMTKLQYKWYGLWIPARAPDFSLLQNVHTALGPFQPATEWVLAIKRPKREADHVQVVINLRMSGTTPLSLYTPSSHDRDLSMPLPFIVSDSILDPVSN